MMVCNHLESTPIKIRPGVHCKFFVFSGSAQNALDTLIEMLRKELGESSVSSLIVSKLKNTMTDRHAAEKLFSSVSSDYRAQHSP